MLCFMEMKTVKYKVLKGQGMKIQLMKEMLKTQASEIFVAALKNLKTILMGNIKGRRASSTWQHI